MQETAPHRIKTLRWDKHQGWCSYLSEQMLLKELLLFDGKKHVHSGRFSIRTRLTAGNRTVQHHCTGPQDRITASSQHQKKHIE